MAIVAMWPQATFKMADAPMTVQSCLYTFSDISGNITMFLPVTVCYIANTQWSKLLFTEILSTNFVIAFHFIS